MIKAWMADVSPLYVEEKYREVYDTLPRFRQLKADGIKSECNKAQSAGVWFLLQTVRSKYNISDKAVFNLSHTGDYVVCCIDTDENTDTLAGVDGEVIHPIPLRLAERFYCKGEYEHILKMEEDRRQEELIRVWVLKESFMKATRKGMALDTRSYEFNLEKEAELIRKPEQYSRNFYFKEYAPLGTSCRVAVCSTDSNICDHIDMSFLNIFA